MRLYIPYLSAALCLLLISGSAFGQNYRAVLVDADNGVHRPNGATVEMDYKEEAEIQVRMPRGVNPETPYPIACLVDRVDVTASTGDKTFTYQLPLPAAGMALRRLQLSVRDVAEKANWNVSVFNVEKLAVTIQVRYMKRPSGGQVTTCSKFQADLEADTQVDAFPVEARHYGVYVLVDLNPIASGGSALTESVLGGIVNSLSFASVDVPAVVGGTASGAMVSAPIAGIDTRKWYRHVQLEVVLIRGAAASDVLGRGAALGLFKPTGDASILKVGVIRRDEGTTGATVTRTRVFGGVSLPTLAAWLSGKKR
jgi:hypothetical protein